MPKTALASFALAALAVAACNPTYAPPVRSVDYGAPGRLEPGEAEVGTGVSLYLTNNVLAGFPVMNSLSLEVAVDWVPAAIGDARDAWLMGSVGLRYTPVGPAAGDDDGWGVDLEAGVGAGVGGADHSDRWWWEIPAAGGYLGLGGGYHFNEYFALYSRGRTQFVAAADIPTTFWWSAKIGLEFTIEPITITLAGGGAGYANRKDSQAGVLADLLISGKFPL